MTTRTPTPARKTARPTAAAKKAAKTSAEDATPATPVTQLLDRLDLRGLLDKLRLPGVDAAGLLDSRRKDVKALVAANEQAYRGFEAVLRRQAEMLTEAMKELGDSADQALARKDSSPRGGDLAGQAKQAFGTALANMKEIAELYTKSQQQVLATLGKRLRDSLEESGQRLGRKR